MKITAKYLRKHGKRIMSPVLAEGEVTGHKHELVTMEGVERYELDGKEYLIVSAEGGVSITHQEHGPRLISPGLYLVSGDREYDYSAGAARRLLD